jgi:hypothetical protein
MYPAPSAKRAKNENKNNGKQKTKKQCTGIAENRLKTGFYNSDKSFPLTVLLHPVIF